MFLWTRRMQFWRPCLKSGSFRSKSEKKIKNYWIFKKNVNVPLVYHSSNIQVFSHEICQLHDWEKLHANFFFRQIVLNLSWNPSIFCLFLLTRFFISKFLFSSKMEEKFKISKFLCSFVHFVTSCPSNYFFVRRASCLQICSKWNMSTTGLHISMGKRCCLAPHIHNLASLVSH